MMRHVRTLGVIGACYVVMVIGCAQIWGVDKEFVLTGAGGAASSTSAAGGNGGANIGGAGGFNFGGGIPDCQDVCSNDLTSVVDSCTEEVKLVCTADQGCSNGECIDNPCIAAEQSNSSTGCEFWALKTALRPQADGACFAAFVANTWAKNVHINVAFDGAPLDPTAFAYIPKVDAGGVVSYAPYDGIAGLPPGEVAILFLSRYDQGVSVIDCPKPAALGLETGFSGTGIGKAFRITTDYPVTAYQMVPFNGATSGTASATMLMPTSAWGTNYIAINAYKAIPDPPPPANLIGGYPSLVVVAKDDATKVTLLPNVDLVGGPGVPAAMANTQATYTLNAGQYLQITQPAELTGSPIEADKPIGVFGASTCMRIPTTQTDCDPGQQQLPRVKALGHEYVAVRYKSRDLQNEEATRWRLVGIVDGTALTWEPAKPENAPTSIKLGEVLEFEATGPFIARSQDSDHPFYLAEYMTGGTPFANVGDPDWHNVVPPAQYLRKYVFFTEPSYPETSLVVVRVRSKITKEFSPVTLKCAGELTGWTPLGSDYEWTRLNLVTGDFLGVNGCTNATQELSSDAPFSVTVWGWGTTSMTLRVSYSMVAGAGQKNLNDVFVPPVPK